MRARRWLCPLLAAALLGLGVGPALADARSEIKDFLRRHNGRYQLADAPALLGLLAQHPDAVSIGPGPGQTFRGRQAIQGALLLGLALVRAVDVRFADNMVISPRGDLAWLGGELRLRAQTHDGRIVDAPARLSAVLVRENGQWRLFQASANLPPELSAPPPARR